MSRRFTTALAVLIFVAMLATASPAFARNLVILHTNDTHSAIDPDENGRGGILQRKAIIDSVRRAEKNVILVDAGDVVQGSLYFKYFKGDVEYPLMEMLGYDIRVLGNHEFDNGMADLTKYWKKLKGKALSTNYDFSGTGLDGVFPPYIIKTVQGRKIGFIGLNVDPSSLIAAGNIEGVRFNDVIATANRTAAFLRNQKHCDLVVAVTHIGYTTKQAGKATDVDLARESRDIDIIIGGHSHTLVTPGTDGRYPSLVPNADGRPVLVTQTGKNGPSLGYISIDLDALPRNGRPSGAEFDYRLIPVTDRFPASRLDPAIIAFLKPYRHVVDSVTSNVIGYAPQAMSTDSAVGAYPNWVADFAYNTAVRVLDSIHRADPASTLPLRPDMAIMNVGGIRLGMPAGNVTEGRILSTFPFANRLTLVRISGKDLLETLAIAARRRGEAISGNVRVAVNPDWSMAGATIDGRPIEPDRSYVVATIDYLAQGNDDLRPLANGRVIWTDPQEISIPILRYIKTMTDSHMPMAADPASRFVRAVNVGGDK